MKMKIYAVHFEDGKAKSHQTIEKFRWSDVANPSHKLTSTKAQMVNRIDNKGDTAFVQDGAKLVPVTTVAGTPRYLRSKPDGVLSDNLLRLTTF